MLGGCPPAGAAECRHHQGHGYLTPEHVAHFGHPVHYLVPGHSQEIHESHLRDGSHPGYGRADGGSQDGCLGEWRVPYPARVLLVQPSDFPHQAAHFAHILSQDVHPLVSLHFLGHRLANRLAKVYLSHFPLLGIYVVQRFFRFRERTFQGELHRFVHFHQRCLVNLFGLPFGQQLHFQELFLEEFYWVPV